MKYNNPSMGVILILWCAVQSILSQGDRSKSRVQLKEGTSDEPPTSIITKILRQGSRIEEEQIPIEYRCWRKDAEKYLISSLPIKPFRDELIGLTGKPTTDLPSVYHRKNYVLLIPQYLQTQAAYNRDENIPRPVHTITFLNADYTVLYRFHPKLSDSLTISTGKYLNNAAEFTKLKTKSEEYARVIKKRVGPKTVVGFQLDKLFEQVADLKEALSAYQIRDVATFSKFFDVIAERDGKNLPLLNYAYHFLSRDIVEIMNSHTPFDQNAIAINEIYTKYRLVWENEIQILLGTAEKPHLKNKIRNYYKSHSDAPLAYPGLFSEGDFAAVPLKYIFGRERKIFGLHVDPRINDKYDSAIEIHDPENCRTLKFNANENTPTLKMMPVDGGFKSNTKEGPMKLICQEIASFIKSSLGGKTQVTLVGFDINNLISRYFPDLGNQLARITRLNTRLYDTKVIFQGSSVTELAQKYLMYWKPFGIKNGNEPISIMERNLLGGMKAKISLQLYRLYPYKSHQLVVVTDWTADKEGTRPVRGSISPRTGGSVKGSINTNTSGSIKASISTNSVNVRKPSDENENLIESKDCARSRTNFVETNVGITKRTSSVKGNMPEGTQKNLENGRHTGGTGSKTGNHRGLLGEKPTEFERGILGKNPYVLANYNREY